MAELADIVAVLESIRSDLGTSAGTSPGVSGPDMREHTEALRENSAAMETLGEEVRDTAAGMRELEDSVDSGSESFGKFRNASRNLGKSLFTTSGAIDMLIGGLTKMASAAMDFAKNSLDAVNKLNALTQGMRAATGVSDALVNHIGEIRDEYKTMGVSIEEAGASTESLVRNMSDFTLVSGELQRELIADSVTLQEIGVSFESFSSTIEVGTKTLGMSAKESADMIYKLRGAARDMRIPVDEFTRKIPQLVTNLAALGDGAFDAAIDMEKLRKETGLSVDSMSKLDAQMGTFEGASKFAAKMNQAFGGNFFDPHQLMQAYDDGPAAVTELIRENLEATGQDIDDMGRRQRDFIAAGANISSEELQRLMREGTQGLDGLMGQTDASREAAAKDAKINMKSHLETAENIASVAMEAPIAAAEKEMRNLVKTVIPYKMAIVDSANAWAIQAAEAKATESAMAAMVANELAVAEKTPAGKAAKGGLQSVVALLALGLQYGIKIGRFAFNASKLFNPWIIAIYGVYDGIMSVKEAGGDWRDYMTGWVFGILGAFGQLAEFLSGGFINSALDALGIETERDFSLLNLFSERSFTESWNELDWAFIGETFEWMEKEFNMTWSDIGDGIAAPFITMKEDWQEFADWIIVTWEDTFGISSKSSKMESLGQDMVDGLLSPFSDINALLEPIMEDMLEAMPAPIRAIYEGGAKLGELATSAATATSESYDAMIEALTGKDAQQNITVVQELDGREVDKKILKVVGGVVQPLTQ